MYFATDDSLGDHLKYRSVTGLATLVDGLVSTLTLGFVSTGLGLRAAYRYARRPHAPRPDYAAMHKDRFVPTLDLWIDDPGEFALSLGAAGERGHYNAAPKIGDPA